MRDLYARLNAVGFDSSFVRESCLPDWWEDSLAKTPANRAVAEAAISRHFGYGIGDLRDAKKALTLPKLGPAKMKKNRDVQLDDVAAGRFVAEHAAALVSRHLHSLPDFTGYKSAAEIRAAILQTAPYVTLSALLAWCWENGIVVVRLARFPKGSKKFDGVAMFTGERPVIVLASAKNSPAWLVFHLAHELGHIMRRHVSPGSESWVDGKIEANDTDEHEREADAFACELLTASTTCSIPDSITASPASVAIHAKNYGKRQAIAPGVVALFYAHSRGKTTWGVAGKVLALLKDHTGGHAMIDAAFNKHLNHEALPESTARFLTVLRSDAQ